MRQTGSALQTGILLTAMVAAAPVSAQVAATRTQEQIQALFDAHQADFDYLLGDWEFTGSQQAPGGDIAFRGYWSAVRLSVGAQILDEYRVVGDTGQTLYVSTTLRSYNAMLDRWELISAEAGTGLQNVGTARREGTQMLIEQKFGVMSRQPSLWRIRYHDIRADRFSWKADRSTDDGKTWVTDFMRIEAHRIGPARTMDPLAPPRRSAGVGS
jgi:hypothetical protein